MSLDRNIYMDAAKKLRGGKKKYPREKIRISLKNASSSLGTNTTLAHIYYTTYTIT